MERSWPAGHSRASGSLPPRSVGSSRKWGASLALASPGRGPLSVDGGVLLGLFLYGFRVAFMACHHIHFVTLDFSAQVDLRLVSPDSGAQLTRHLMHVIFVQVEFLGDLLIGEIQAHQVQTQDPGPQGLMVPRENR